MKKLLRKSIVFLSLILILSNYNCDSLGSDDPCDASVLNPSISVQVKGVFFLYENDTRSEREVMITFDKYACGNDAPVPQGHFEFKGFMNTDDYFRSGQVGYNLRNENDKVQISFYFKHNNAFQHAFTNFLKSTDFKNKPEIQIEVTTEI
ncbi:MAG: hypothetical protein WAO52_19290 [Prolixibacteraceae bacterium]